MKEGQDEMNFLKMKLYLSLPLTAQHNGAKIGLKFFRSPLVKNLFFGDPLKYSDTHQFRFYVFRVISRGCFVLIYEFLWAFLVATFNIII